MKAKVLKRFRDKHTRKIYQPGEVITITKKRFAEILEVGPLVEEASEGGEDEAKEGAEDEAKEGAEDEAKEGTEDEAPEE